MRRGRASQGAGSSQAPARGSSRPSSSQAPARGSSRPSSSQAPARGSSRPSRSQAADDSTDAAGCSSQSQGPRSTRHTRSQAADDRSEAQDPRSTTHIRGQGLASSSQASSQEQPSQAHRQAERFVASMNPADVQKKVDELVQYLLIMDQKKYLIKKLDICKTVLKEHSKALPELIARAGEKLLNVFGIELVDLPGKNKGSYILINTLENTTHFFTWSEDDNAKTGLLTVILSIIFMKNNVILDGDLWKALKPFGINPELLHETFGDVKKLVTQEFARQGYLEFTKLPNMEEPVSEVRWGPRAKLEIAKKEILKFVALAYKSSPEEWAAEYYDATHETMDTA